MNTKIQLSVASSNKRIVSIPQLKSTKAQNEWTCLAHAVVGEFDVTLEVHEDVVELEVAVDDLALVEEVHGDADLRGVELGVVLRQPALPLHVVHQVPAVYELDHEEQPATHNSPAVMPPNPPPQLCLSQPASNSSKGPCVSTIAPDGMT